MEEKLTLKDGTVIRDARALLSGDLYLYAEGIGMDEWFGLLIDPAKTAKITATQMDGTKNIYKGYTKLISVRDEGGGMMTASLRGGK